MFPLNSNVENNKEQHTSHNKKIKVIQNEKTV